MFNAGRQSRGAKAFAIRFTVNGSRGYLSILLDFQLLQGSKSTLRRGRILLSRAPSAARHYWAFYLSPPLLPFTVVDVRAACEVFEEEGVRDGDLPTFHVHAGALVSGVVFVEQGTIDG